MADFVDQKKRKHNDYDQLHEACRTILLKERANAIGQKPIVVTHHVPSELNTAFETELFDLTERSKVVSWILGHVMRWFWILRMGIQR